MPRLSQERENNIRNVNHAYAEGAYSVGAERELLDEIDALRAELKDVRQDRRGAEDDLIRLEARVKQAEATRDAVQVESSRLALEKQRLQGVARELADQKALTQVIFEEKQAAEARAEQAEAENRRLWNVMNQ